MMTEASLEGRLDFSGTNGWIERGSVACGGGE